MRRGETSNSTDEAMDVRTSLECSGKGEPHSAYCWRVACKMGMVSVQMEREAGPRHGEPGGYHGCQA